MRTDTHKSKSQIMLVVEDSPEDYYAVRRGLDNAGYANSIVRCESGEEALDYLRGQGRYVNDKELRKPDLILLDLNLPGLSGGEVLEFIKTDASLYKIPVVVISTSGDPDDIEQSYAKGANCYMRKSLHEEKIMQDMQLLNDYWFGAVILPNQQPRHLEQ